MISKETERALRDAIANAEDNAYRYEHLGGTPRDRAYAREIRVSIDAMKADLARLKGDA